VYPSRSLRWAGLAAAVAGLAGLTACGSGASTSGSGAQLTTVTMGIEPWIGYAPWYIAQKQGYFAKHGLAVTITNFQQDADRNTALLAGKTDVSNIDTGRTIQFAAKGQPGVPLMLEDASVGADAMMSVTGISTAAQLSGQTVAYEYGTTSDLLLHYFLLQHHMAFSAVKSVNVPAADAGTLLIAGKDKVVVTYQPYISEATSSPAATGKVHVFFSSAQAPGLISDFLVANKGWLAGHAKQARELVQAWNDAISYFTTHRTQAIAIMAQGVGATPSSLASTLAGVKLYSVSENLALINSGQLAQRYLDIGNTLKAMGQISHSVPLTSVAQFGYLK
jgi:NitT/TauT family transport system substrate-binding protein